MDSKPDFSGSTVAPSSNPSSPRYMKGLRMEEGGILIGNLAMQLDMEERGNIERNILIDHPPPTIHQVINGPPGMQHVLT